MRKITILMAIIAMNAGGMYLCADTFTTKAARTYYEALSYSNSEQEK